MKHLARAMCVAVAVGVLGAGSAAAQTPDVSGRWDVVLNAPDGAHSATLTLKADGAKLTGTIGNGQGDIPIEGTLSGTDMTLTFTYRGGGEPRLITMKGARHGDSIGGTATFGEAPATGPESGPRRRAVRQPRRVVQPRVLRQAPWTSAERGCSR